MLASPKDEWRLRIHTGSVAAGWLGTSHGKCEAAARTFPGLFKNWDTVGSRRDRGREVRQAKQRTRTVYVRCRRQFMDAVICADLTWSRTVPGPGRIVSIALFAFAD